jgi:type I restriction enzyme, S subunit
MSRHRFKHFLRERNEFSISGDETLLSVSEYYGVKPRSEAFEGDHSEGRAATLEGYRVVKSGDLVMNYMLAWKGAYGLSDHNGITSPAYAVYEIDTAKVDRRFLHHRTRSRDMQAEFRSRSKGIIESRLRLYPDALLALEVDLPDLPTQKRIAAFLDRETARIDDLIAKKERLGDVIDQRRLAVITAAVAGQIGPAAGTPSKQDALGGVCI